MNNQTFKLTAAAERNDELINQLTELWERSVRKSHLFLSEKEILKIRDYVSDAIREVDDLLLAEDEDGSILGFAGISRSGRLEMLFVDADRIGSGIGKALLNLAVQEYGIKEVTVNEQNPAAIGFYEHAGFRTVSRTETDEQGNPYPLLYLELFND